VALWRASDAALESLASGGPMTRAPVVSMRRNLAIAIGNSAGSVPLDLLDDERDPARPSVDAPAVAEAVRWARACLRERHGHGEQG
jgi:hypothetical protein